MFLTLMQILYIKILRVVIMFKKKKFENRRLTLIFYIYTEITFQFRRTKFQQIKTITRHSFNKFNDISIINYSIILVQYANVKNNKKFKIHQTYLEFEPNCFQYSIFICIIMPI